MYSFVIGWFLIVVRTQFGSWLTLLFLFFLTVGIHASVILVLSQWSLIIMSCLFYPACMYLSQWITTTFFKIYYYGTIYRTMKLSCELQDQRFLEEALMMCDSMMNGTANTWYSKKVKRKPSKNGNTTKRYVSFTLVPFSSIPCSSLLAWVS